MALKGLCVYYSDSSDSSDSDDILHPEDEIRTLINDLLTKVEGKNQYTSHREIQNDSDLDSDSDLSHLSIESSDQIAENDQFRSCLTKGELSYDDLPKIEKLNINSPVEQLTQVGFVSTIVNQLVIIKAFNCVPVLDLECVLFYKNGSELGQVFDVIGPVREPNYVLRFNSFKEIKDAKIEINMPVYFNQNFPEPYTKYVFITNLIKEKGSDASWKHNNEPPPEALDYSDDETERKEKWKMAAKKRSKN